MRYALRLLALALAVTLIGGLVSTSQASESPTAVEYGKKSKKAKKAKKKAIKKATKAVRDGQYVGVRGDGEVVDWTFCKNRKFYLSSTGAYGTGISKGKGWKVTVAKQTKHGFWAIVNFGNGGYVALSKSRKQWKVGIEYFDKPSQMGKATRTNAKASCKTL